MVASLQKARATALASGAANSLGKTIAAIQSSNVLLARCKHSR